MGKLLLTHLNLTQLPCDDAVLDDSSDEDLPVFNTFIHFKVPHEVSSPRHAALRRHRTAPSPRVMRGASTSVAGNDAFKVDSNASPSPMGSDMPDVKSTCQYVEEKSLSNDVPSQTQDASKFVGAETPVISSPTHANLDVPTNPTPSSSWLVDGRRLRGRDTRISSPLRPQIGGGPDCLDIVVTIFPVCKSNKRGGSCFKASEGVGHIQLKCNNPIDQELSVCITVGSCVQRCQRHNFADNALMQFIGDWNFTNFIDSCADRPTVAVTLQLLTSDEALHTNVEGHAGGIMIAPAIADPAIAAFSLSTKAYSQPSVHLPFQLEEPWQTKKAKVVFGDFGDEDQAGGYEGSTMPSSTPEHTPLATPRTPPSAPLPPMMSPTGTQSPPSSPFFQYRGSLLFSFTVRRADGVLLGLDVDPDEIYQELLVLKVIPGGAAEAWNRQCFAGPFSSKAVVPTDRIVGINGRCDCAGMLDECRHNHLLKLFIVRGDLPHADIPMGWCGTPIPGPAIQFIAVPVPVLFQVACVKHVSAVCEGGPMTTHAIEGGPMTAQAPNLGTLRASASEFVPTATGQNADTDVTESADETIE